MRRTRGDGNCFFRAFAFGYLETLLNDNSDLPRYVMYVEHLQAQETCNFMFTNCRFRDAVIKIKDSLLAMGYPSFTLEDFHDTVSLLSDHTYRIDDGTVKGIKFYHNYYSL